MIITEILPYGKMKSRVLTDGDLVFSVYRGELKKYGLEEGAELSERMTEEVLLPLHSARRGRQVTLADLNREAGLRAVAPTLRNNRAVRVLHSADDFLLDDADREFLRGTLGDRLTVFEHGGHLGNLYRDEVRQAMVKALQEPR